MKYLTKLKKLTTYSNHTQHRLSCIIVKKGRPVSFGFNKLKTHSKSPNKFNMIHAEVDAMIKLRRMDATGCVAYVYRESRNGKMACSRPCQDCQRAFLEKGITTIFFSTDVGFEELILD